MWQLIQRGSSRRRSGLRHLEHLENFFPRVYQPLGGSRAGAQAPRHEQFIGRTPVFEGNQCAGNNLDLDGPIDNAMRGDAIEIDDGGGGIVAKCAADLGSLFVRHDPSSWGRSESALAKDDTT